MRRVIETTDSIITGPTVEPLDLDEVKKALKVSSASEDTLIDVWISAARMLFETETGRQILTATREYTLDAFPCQPYIELPAPPLQSVLSIQYDDSDGAEQTLADTQYTVSAEQQPLAKRGVIQLVAGASWPATSGSAQSVRVRYVAGYGDAVGDVPELVRAALYFYIGHFHKFRAEVHEASRGALQQLPLGAQMIVRSFSNSALPQWPQPVRSEWVV